MKNSRYTKILFVYLIDVFNCIFASYIAYALRLDTFSSISRIFLINILDFKIFFIPIFLFSILFFFNSFYSNVFRYLNVQLNLKVFSVFLIYYFVYVLLMFYLRQDQSNIIPRTLIFLQPIIFYFLFIFSRFFISHIIFGSVLDDKKKIKLKKRCLIIGINKRSVEFAKFLNNSSMFMVYGFIDDTNQSDGNKINGLKVYNIKNINKAIQDFNITDFLIAIENSNQKKKEKVFNFLKKFKKRINFLPFKNNFIDLDTELSEINYDEILFPKRARANNKLLNQFFKNKIVAISGAGGSIGSVISKEIINLNIKKLILIDKNEYNLFSLKKKIENLKDLDVDYFLGDLTDLTFVQSVFKNKKINVFYHAAAYKHVELLEENYISGIKNNVMSTLYSCEEAIKNSVEYFCLISSDKAVNPAGIMGMTKKFCEKILINCNNSKSSKFFSVRFGNVINSSGSVMPIFRDQIKNKLPVTVTHKSVSRYFMHTIDAANLVLESTTIAENKKIYALDMGKPFKIYNLAKKMISLYGYDLKEKNKKGDIEIVITGLKNGEKLNEEIFLGKKLKKTLVPKIFIETKYDRNIRNFNIMTKKMISKLKYDDSREGLKIFKKLIS